MLSSHIVSCGSAICPIMPSTASVAMKPLFGVKLGRLYLRSTIWITTSHMRECGVRLGGERPDLKNYLCLAERRSEEEVNAMGPPSQATSSPQQRRGQPAISCGVTGIGGGPLVTIDRKGQKYQVGIISSGEEVCSQSGVYGVFTRISSHADWIKQILPHAPME